MKDFTENSVRLTWRNIRTHRYLYLYVASYLELKHQYGNKDRISALSAALS